jgi:hypothetical protein
MLGHALFDGLHIVLPRVARILAGRLTGRLHFHSGLDLAESEITGGGVKERFIGVK